MVSQLGREEAVTIIYGTLFNFWTLNFLIAVGWKCCEILTILIIRVDPNVTIKRTRLSKLFATDGTFVGFFTWNQTKKKSWKQNPLWRKRESFHLPVWILRWFESVLSCRNCFPQKVQLNGFSPVGMRQVKIMFYWMFIHLLPVWIFIWFDRVVVWRNSFEHIVHL